MVVQFNLPIKAFSVNATYYRNRAFKTKEFRHWEHEVGALLEDIKDLADLALEYQRVGGEFHVSFTFVYPHRTYWNQAKEISAKTFDLSNVEKPLLDQIFGGRMDVNDRFVTKLVSKKRAGIAHEIEIKIELMPKAA